MYRYVLETTNVVVDKVKLPEVASPHTKTPSKLDRCVDDGGVGNGDIEIHNVGHDNRAYCKRNTNSHSSEVYSTPQSLLQYTTIPPTI